MATALARQLPLALVVDIDGLRTQLGQWETRTESRLLARDLAISLIETHLESGYDVIVPQFLGRLEFIERLEEAARAAGGSFVEVLLAIDRESAERRFRERRAALAGVSHPEGDVAEADVETAIAAADDAIAEVYRQRPGAIRVDASGDLARTGSALSSVLSAT